jgi:hypothetical protein
MHIAADSANVVRSPENQRCYLPILAGGIVHVVDFDAWAIAWRRADTETSGWHIRRR